jgi:uracil-DNA glycosylase family 4
MAVTYSPILDPKANPCKNKVCKACGLYLNQPPIFDKQRKSSVFWVGLSAVRFDEDQEMLPLSPITASGSLIHQIEKPFAKKILFYKTNLVKCVPLKDDKIRYPLEHEMQKCFPNFEWELENLSPSTVFLLGKQVATFVLKKLSNCKPSFNDSFIYSPITINEINFIPIHHPSYVLVYKRKSLECYIRNIQLNFPQSKRNLKKGLLEHETI